MRTTTYDVMGTPDGHSIATLTRHISDLYGVLGVGVEGTGTGKAEVRVASARALPVASVRAAVREAGFELAEDAKEADARAHGGLRPQLAAEDTSAA